MCWAVSNHPLIFDSSSDPSGGWSWHPKTERLESSTWNWYPKSSCTYLVHETGRSSSRLRVCTKHNRFLTDNLGSPVSASVLSKLLWGSFFFSPSIYLIIYVFKHALDIIVWVKTASRAILPLYFFLQRYIAVHVELHVSSSFPSAKWRNKMNKKREIE